MRSAGVYLIQVEIGSVRNALIPQGDLLITLRIGRNSAIATFTNRAPTSQLAFGMTMQLNVDHSALQTQRCSLSFNGPDKKIVGIALISLPKDKNFLQNTYRLTQNEDKRAEIQVKIRIAPFQSTNSGEIKQNLQTVKSESSLPKEPSRTVESNKITDNIVPKIYSNTLNRIESSSNNPQNGRLKTKASEQLSNFSSQDRKTPKNFKMREEDKMIQTTQSQLKRYKDEKEAYYQLYQIQKSKNEVASKFITNFLRKIAEKAPSLVSVLSQPESKKSEGQKKPSKNSQNHQQVDTAKIQQLQQANRSLHRQVEEYKRIVEQMRIEISRGNKVEMKLTKPANNFLYPGIFDADGKSTLKEKSSIKSSAASALKDDAKPTDCLQQIDFKKWLNVSIGQRESIQGLLSSLAQRPPTDAAQKNDNLLKRLKASVDKSFTSLLTRKQVTKDALINHRKEVNRLFEEIASA